jgi:hypothetical protein
MPKRSTGESRVPGGAALPLSHNSICDNELVAPAHESPPPGCPEMGRGAPAAGRCRTRRLQTRPVRERPGSAEEEVRRTRRRHLQRQVVEPVMRDGFHARGGDSDSRRRTGRGPGADT